MITKMAKEYDIRPIQEHHKFRKRDMKTGPYIIAGFAPAQRTVRTKNGRGWHSSGGVAILVRDNLYFEKDKHIPQQGLNWAAIKIRLKRQPGQPKGQSNSINIITSYTKHGSEYETITTFDQVQKYIDQYTCPYIWGADFNRSPAEMVTESESRYMAIATHAPQVRTTCSVGGLIDYFVTHENERTIIGDISVIKDTVVTPHSPVAATINESIYATRTLQQVVAPKWPQGDPVHEKVTWEEAQRILAEDIKWEINPFRFLDEMQEYYVKT